MPPPIKLEGKATGQKEKTLVIYIPKDQGRVEVRKAPPGYKYVVKDWSERGKG